HPGDLFVFCSDGVFEATNGYGEEFTGSRLIDVITQVRDLPPAKVVAAIFGAVETFRDGASPNDDTTAVAVRINS
ncbi:MAG TPA: SpoIIE family protein phosphatase, partial [Vicinamibacterales bacterium]